MFYMQGFKFYFRAYRVEHDKFVSREAKVLGHLLEVVSKHLNDIMSLGEWDCDEEAGSTFDVKCCYEHITNKVWNAKNAFLLCARWDLDHEVPSSKVLPLLVMNHSVLIHWISLPLINTYWTIDGRLYWRPCEGSYLEPWSWRMLIGSTKYSVAIIARSFTPTDWSLMAPLLCNSNIRIVVESYRPEAEGTTLVTWLDWCSIKLRSPPCWRCCRGWSHYVGELTHVPKYRNLLVVSIDHFATLNLRLCILQPL